MPDLFNRNNRYNGSTVLFTTNNDPWRNKVLVQRSECEMTERSPTPPYLPFPIPEFPWQIGTEQHDKPFPVSRRCCWNEWMRLSINKLITVEMEYHGSSRRKTDRFVANVCLRVALRCCSNGDSNLDPFLCDICSQLVVYLTVTDQKYNWKLQARLCSDQCRFSSLQQANANEERRKKS